MEPRLTLIRGRCLCIARMRIVPTETDGAGPAASRPIRSLALILGLAGSGLDCLPRLLVEFP